jgi:hypothetical protein
LNANSVRNLRVHGSIIFLLCDGLLLQLGAEPTDISSLRKGPNCCSGQERNSLELFGATNLFDKMKENEIQRSKMASQPHIC